MAVPLRQLGNLPAFVTILKSLLPQPEDDSLLTIRLDKFKAEQQREFEARSEEVATLLKLLAHRQSIIGFAHFYKHLAAGSMEVGQFAHDQFCLHELNQERLRLPLYFTHGCLKWTLDDARQRSPIRNPILRARWAKQNNWDFQQKASERNELLDWLDLSAPFRETMVAASGLSLDYSRPDYVDIGLTDSLSDLGAASWNELLVGALTRHLVKFADGRRAWLTDFTCRPPQNAGERAEFGATQGGIASMETIKDGHGQVLTKLDSVEKKTDMVLSGVKTLTELAGEQSLTRDVWAENPLGSREGSADYLLSMRAVGIKGERASALVHFGYGETRKKCAEMAGVSIESIKRDLARARQTPYAKFFARTRQQKLEARKAMKKPDDAFARMSQLAKEDPDKLRAITDQLIAKAQRESDGGNQWDSTVAGIS